MFEKVRDVIVDTLGCEAEAVTMEATLTEDLGLDSIDAVELNIALEDALGTHVDLVSTTGMDEDFLREVQKNEVLLYESA